MFFIEGSYQASLWAQNPLFAINFFVGIIPLAFIMNFLYYKNGRSITLIILFHVLVNYSSELFEADQVSKVIFTLVLAAVAMVIIPKNKEFFFNDKMNLDYVESPFAAKEASRQEARDASCEHCQRRSGADRGMLQAVCRLVRALRSEPH